MKSVESVINVFARFFLCAPGAGPELCVVQTPLVTPLFKAWRQRDAAVATRGCHSRPNVFSKAAYEVRVALSLSLPGRPRASG